MDIRMAVLQDIAIDGVRIDSRVNWNGDESDFDGCRDVAGSWMFSSIRATTLLPAGIPRRPGLQGYRCFRLHFCEQMGRDADRNVLPRGL